MDEAGKRRLGDRLSPHQVVGIDSAVFIYHFEAHPVYFPLAQHVLVGITEQRYHGITSVVTLMEVTVQPWRANTEVIAREYETLLVRFPNLQLVEIDRNIARHAAQLRVRFGIRTPDALQVAATIEYGATAFVTNDRKLRRLAGTVDVVTLQDFLHA